MTRAVFLFAGPALLAQAPVTFNKDVAPIVMEHCAPCHRPGESAPFALLTYADVKKHAQQIVTVTKSRYMPPWLPEPGYGRFAGERRLGDEQIRVIARWVEHGEVEGRAADLPPLPKFAEGWQLGEPDLVLTLPKPYTLQASGPDTYRNFIFTFPLDGVGYVRALEIRPGNKRVVHHANLLIDRNRSSRARDGRDGQPGFPGMDLKIDASVRDPESHFLFWKPGSVLTEEPPGMAWTIRKDTDLVLNMHLQPSGKPELIQPSLGLYFTKEPPRFHPLLVQLENDRALDIPPGKTDFAITDDFTLPVDADLLGVYPHAHYLGKEVRGKAKLPDGSEKPLIWIRHWDSNWQAVYRYAAPVFLPKGTTVSMRWVYDNSSANPANPNHPPQRVVAGDRSTDEMGHLWLQLLPRGPGDQRMLIQESVLRGRVRKDPEDFTARFNLGGLLEEKGDRTAAIAQLREAVRIRPRDETALNSLAALLQMEDKAEEAERLYREALRIRPDYTDAQYNLAMLLLARGGADEAIDHLRVVVRAQSNDERARAALVEALQARGRERASQRNMEGAVADLREAVSLEPNNADAITNLGTGLAMAGKMADAKEMFERAVRLNPGSAIARQNLERAAKALAKSGQP